MNQPEPQKRRALGKGLEALLPRTPLALAEPSPAHPAAASSPATTSAVAPRITEVLTDTGPGVTALEIRLKSIDRNPYQTRTRFDDRQLIELAASISAHGVVQPVIVRPLPEGRYQLIAGERRWLASQLANRETIPAIVRQVSDGQAMEMTVIENLQRSDLNPIEQARAYERLSREFKLTQEQMAQRTGKDRATVANFLRLLRLPAAVQTKVEGGELSFGHARSLLALEDADAILRATQKVLALSMSVRQTETYVQGLLNPEKKAAAASEPPPVVDPNVREARDALQRALGLRVSIEDKQGRGRVIIEYSGLEDFDSLMAALVGE